VRWASGRVLHDRTFRVVAAGEVVSVLGDYAYQVAFAWLVLSVTGSTLTLAAVMICNVVPNGLLILVGGAITDRWSPRRCDVLLARVTGAAGLRPVPAHAHRLGAYLAVLRGGCGLRAG
jgi:Transmembrane secretion effector